jgi:4-amino-4-deoxy-L-arabinose transferase-like glycosyltransferase
VSNRTARALGLLVVAALAVRLIVAWNTPTDEAALSQLPDQREYLALAQNLRSGNGLVFMDERFGERATAYRTPGYPAFVAVFGANPRLARTAQCVIGASVVIAVFLLARKWQSHGRALIAAGAMAFNPFLIYFCRLLLTETLFSAMLAWGMVLLLHRRTLLWLMGGILLALAVLVRPGALALPVVLGLLAAVQNRGGRDAYHRRWPLPVGTTMLLLTLAALAPWAYRNHLLLGQWIWTSTNGGITSYDGFNPDASGASDQSFVDAMPQLRGMSELQRDAYLAEKAKLFMRNNPLRALQLAGIKMARTWSPMPLSAEFARRAYVAVALVYSLPFFLLVVAGLVSKELPASAKVFLLAPAVYFTLSAALSVGSLRYRIPAEVPMAVVAAAGVRALPIKRGPAARPLRETPQS